MFLIELVISYYKAICIDSEHMTIEFSGRHFKKEIILQAVRWYLAYSLSYRDIEELMQDEGREKLSSAEQFYSLAA